MLIRVGYELIFDVPAPVPMLLMLDLVPEREASVRRFGGMRIEPFAPTDRFIDRFGNRCTRIVAPAGQLRIWDDLVVEDSGWPDPVAPEARQIPSSNSPSTSWSTCWAAAIARSTGSPTSPGTSSATSSGGWARVQAVCDWVHDQRPVRLPLRPPHQDGLRRL